MKIALIGNMNNANFALMRYFRDLGCDAHLLLYSNDGQGALGHFRPESDTWQIERWQPYIHQTDIPNAPVAALDFPYSSLIGIGAMIRSWLGFQEGWVPPVSRKQIRSAYAGYDRLVASGISPATLSRAGIALDIFFPYSTGVEFLRTGEFLVRFDGRFGINSFLFTRVAQRQIDGIRAAHNVLNAVMGMTNDVLLDIGVRGRVHCQLLQFMVMKCNPMQLRQQFCEIWRPSSQRRISRFCIKLACFGAIQVAIQMRLGFMKVKTMTGCSGLSAV
jgi:hypothetical protein